MKYSRLGGFVVSVTAATAASLGAEGNASACGGSFTPPPPPQVKEVESIITDERVILSVSPGQTTLYDEIEYSGSPSSFAWVLPIKGKVTVGLSADILFATLDQLTATQVIEPPANCPPPPACNSGGGFHGCGSSGGSQYAEADGGFADDGSAPGDHGGGVTVLGQQQVGPYETVQLHSNDGSALEDWLKSHGYRIPASDAPVIAAYVADHFDFLALKLVPGEGVQAMQPVRVTTEGAAPSLPLHMVAVGTGATTGITVWIVADARWAPKNFPTFTVDDAEIAWDWATSSSDYESVRLAKEAKLGGRGWQIESSLSINERTLRNALTTAAERTYAPGNSTPVGPEPTDGGAGEAGLPGDGGATEAGSPPPSVETAGEAAQQDLDTLFHGVGAYSGNARITRMRSDAAHAALSEDMILEPSADSSELTNVHYPQGEIGQPQCPVYDDDCVQIGTAPRDQAAADSQGGCNTTRRESGSRTTLALLASAAVFGAIRIRRRRARREGSTRN